MRPCHVTKDEEWVWISYLPGLFTQGCLANTVALRNVSINYLPLHGYHVKHSKRSRDTCIQHPDTCCNWRHSQPAEALGGLRARMCAWRQTLIQCSLYISNKEQSRQSCVLGLSLVKRMNTGAAPSLVWRRCWGLEWMMVIHFLTFGRDTEDSPGGQQSPYYAGDAHRTPLLMKWELLWGITWLQISAEAICRQK